MRNRILTITGGDLCGKETQSKILVELFTAHGIHAERMEFPRYDRPIGKLMGAMLDEGAFVIDGYFEPGSYWQDDEDCWGVTHTDIPLRGNGRWFGDMSKVGRGKVYQLLCMAGFFDVEQEMADTLERGWLVCDRYEVDSLVFGALDTGDVSIIEKVFEGLKHRSEIVFALINSGPKFVRPGEILDVNERNVDFQERIRQLYVSSAETRGWHLIDVAKYTDPDLVTSVANVTRKIVDTLNDSYQLQINFLDRDLDMIARILREKDSLAA